MRDGMQKVTFDEIKRLDEYEKGWQVSTKFLEEMSEQKTKEGLLHTISTWSKELLAGERCSIALVDPGDKTFSVFALTGNDIIPQGQRIPIDQSGLGIAIRQNATYISSDNRLNLDLLDCAGLVKGGLLSYLDMPFSIGGKVYGTLNIASEQVGHFNILDCIRVFPLTLLIKSYFKNYEANRELLELAERERILIAKNVEASKFASLGQMAGGIAHEISNPLSILKGIVLKVRTLETKGRLDKDSLEENLAKIDKTIDRTSQIVKGLRNFSRDGSNDPFKLIKAKPLLEETVGFCQARLRENRIDVSLKAEAEGIMAFCRPVQLQQVLVNLINNSIDAIFKQDCRWIRIQLSEEMPGTCKISVTDSGDGIDEQNVDKIMEPFFTTKAVGDGTGLGLSISKRIMKDHGGNLELNSASDTTEFIITLPSTSNTQQSAQDIYETSEELRSQLILLVDDEAELVELLRFALEDSGLSCKVAHSGNDAMRMLEEHNFSVVISDVRMPNGTGVDILRFLTAREGGGPAVVLATAFSDTETDQLKQLGAKEVLEKPINVPELIRLLESLAHQPSKVAI